MSEGPFPLEKGTTESRPLSELTADERFQLLVAQEAGRLVQEIEFERANLSQVASSGRIFTRFEIATDVVENVTQTLTAGVWSSGLGTLKTFHTASAQSQSSGQYFYDVYDSSSNGQVQFAVSYGHRLGSGSLGTNEDSPSKAIYSQYRNVLLEPSTTQFTFAQDQNLDDIYVLNFQRARIKEKLNAGAWELVMSGSVGNRLIKLIDDSPTNTTPTLGVAGRIFNVVSGTIDGGVQTAASNQPGGGYGLFYPDAGIIILNPTLLDASASVGTGRNSNTNDDNSFKLFTSISGSSAQDSAQGFKARNEEGVVSTHYFVRVKNAEYNFSNNPTFVTGSDGDIAESTFIGDPKVYITTVGLYNDSNELLAIAKISKPLLKSFDKETLIRVKLDF